MRVSIHSTGTTPRDRDKLNILHREGAISAAVFFRKDPGILSGPHALLGSRLSRTSLTSEAVSSIESSFSPTSLEGGALSVGEAVLAGLNTELKNLFRMLALSRINSIG